MKRLIFIAFLWLLAGGMLSAQNPDGQEFTIRGEIAGLAVGDTLRFERIDLPEWSYQPGFDVVVTAPDRFEYTGRQPHIQYYIMTYRPYTRQLPQVTLYGLTMIIDGGTVTVTGSVDDIYFSRVEGEAFGEQPLLQEAQDLDNSIERERSRLYRLTRAAFESGDSVKANEYQKLYRDFYSKEKSMRMDDLRDEFRSLHPSSPWTMVNWLSRSASQPIDSLQAYYARLDASARASHYGILLGKMVDELVRLLPGKPAPEFNFTLQDGTVMNSEMFRGKYLIIYHWGFCPGSIQLEEDATNLYNRFKEHLHVLGITDNLEAIRKTAQTTPPDAEAYGVNLKKAFESMSVHPWIDIEKTGDNQKIGELYAFGGYPFFVLISPDGKIVSRGYSDTLFEAKKILKDQFESKP